MGNKNFHDKPYDAGTLGKLRVFELYAQEWNHLLTKSISLIFFVGPVPIQ